MTEFWYIDALDGLSGLAFASFRRPDLTNGADVELDLSFTGRFISAPDFQPEPISSRAIGLAAAQRGLQLGLSLDGATEVPFPSLEALAEYVRRLYISGGGGDGAGGVGPAPGGGSPEEGGDLDGEPTPISLAPYEGPLVRFGEAMLEQSFDMRGDQLAESLKDLDSPDQVQDLADDGHPLDLVLQLLIGEIEGRLGVTAEKDPERLSLSRARYNMLKLMYALARFEVGEDWIVRRAWFSGSLEDDILDVLASLPIPWHVCRSETRTESWRTVKDLFYGLLANPSLLVQTRYRAERSALFLFAAAAMVRRGKGLQLAGTDPSFRRQAVRAMMDEVFHWLTPQMPRYVFSKDVEQTIVDAQAA